MAVFGREEGEVLGPPCFVRGGDVSVAAWYVNFGWLGMEALEGG